MAVYVDDYNAPFNGMIMCHLVADTTDELLAMVDLIGVQRKWIQCPGTPKEHFDICLSKKKLAIKHGAVAITVRQMGLLTLEATGRLDSRSSGLRQELEDLRAGRRRWGTNEE